MRGCTSFSQGTKLHVILSFYKILRTILLVIDNVFGFCAETQNNFYIYVKHLDLNEKYWKVLINERFHIFQGLPIQ